MGDDLISRQAAIEALDDEITITGKTNAVIVQDYIRRVNNRLHDLPPAQPETTTWTEKETIYINEPHPIIEAWQSMKCSKCERYYTTPYAYYLEEPNYCPHCGRKTERRADD